MRLRRVLASIVAPAMVAGLMVAASPPAWAAKRTTTEVSYPQVCRAFPPKSSGQGPSDSFQDKVVFTSRVTERVEKGKLLLATMTVVPDAVNTEKLPLGAKLVSNSRFKMDLQLPEGLDFFSADFEYAPDANLRGFAAFTVNEEGQPDPDGRILRVASPENATVGNSPNSSESTPAAVAYTVTNTRIELKFPTLKLRLKATKPGQWSVGVRHANGASDFGKNPKNYLTFLATVQVPILGSLNAPTYCTPRATAGGPFDEASTQLFTVTVVEKGAPAQPAARTQLSSLTASSPTAGALAPVSVSVSPANAAGTVTFSAGDTRRTFQVVGGTAEGQMYFPTAGDTTLSATFTPTDPTRFLPATTTTTVVVDKAATPLTLSVAQLAKANSDMQVAALVPADARGEVRFEFGGQTVTALVGSTGRAEATLPAGDTGTKTLVATFLPAAGSSFLTATTQAEITVTDVSTTQLALRVEPTVPVAGQTVTVTATLIPASTTGTAVAPKGVVLFSNGTTTVTGTLDTGTLQATAQLAAGEPGSRTFSATFLPTAAGQTKATAAPVTITVESPTEPTVTVTPQGPIHPGEATTFAVAVDPVSDGTITASVNGRETQAPIDNGAGTITITPGILGEQVVAYAFTPAPGSATAPVDGTFTITATEKTTGPGGDDNTGPADIDTAGLIVDMPEKAEADTAIPVTIRVADIDDNTRGINGYITVTADGKTLMRDGKPITTRVVEGNASLNLSFRGGGPQAVTFAFFTDDGTRIAGAQKLVTISGGIVVEPPAPPKQGLLQSIISLLMQIFAPLKNLFGSS